MKLYRICTENKNREQVEQAVGILFDGFTVYETTGYWQRKQEASLVIEILAEDEDRSKVKSIATTIRDFNKQECVLVQVMEIEAKFV